jgi:hypothetical protein
VAINDPGGMCRNTSHGGGHAEETAAVPCRARRRHLHLRLRRHQPHAIPTPTPSPTPTPPDANAERRHDLHDYVRGSVTRTLTVPPGTRVTFVNNDTRVHEMDSDPHPDHTDCPEINQVDLLTRDRRS